MKTISPIKLRLLMAAGACGLLTCGCWPAHPHSAYGTIHQCAINGDAAGMSAELTAHPDELNLPEDDGLTPLHLAAENCHTNVVVLLLDKGAKLSVKGKDNETPLHLAAQEGCGDVVAILLTKGADMNARDNQGRTPLARAQQWHQTNVVTLLQQHGATQ
jgi:ankyrin repeat protein